MNPEICATYHSLMCQQPIRSGPSSVYIAQALLDRTSTDRTLARRARVKERSESNDHVRCDQQTTFEVITSSIQHQEIDHECCDKETDSLKEVEVKTHAGVQDPAEQDDNRGDEEGDLNRGPDSDTDCQIHLVLGCDGDSCDVLGCVSDDREDNETDEGFAHRAVVDHVWNGVDHEFGTGSDQSDCEEE